MIFLELNMKRQLPVPKEIKKKIKTKTDEIVLQVHENYNKDLTAILDGKFIINSI
jgi:hypothetical protein